MKILLIAPTQRQGKYWAKELGYKDFVVITKYEKILGYKGLKYKYVGEYWTISKLLEIEDYVATHEMEEEI